MDGKTGDWKWPEKGKKPQIRVFTEIIWFVIGKCGSDSRRFKAEIGVMEITLIGWNGSSLIVMSARLKARAKAH